MRIKVFFQDDEAVAPVISVILMVAITVILAAVIASFVLGLGDQASDVAPQASFSFDYDESGDADANEALLTIGHDGGDTLAAEELYVRGSGYASGGTMPSEADTNSDTAWSATDKYGVGSEVTAGDTLVVNVADDYDIRVVFQSQQTDTSATLGKDSGPAA